MTQLLDLPPELLSLIFDELGGRELRRDVSNLTVCWKWYEASHGVYLSGLDVGRVRIHGCDIDDLAVDWSSPTQRPLMHRNTRTLQFLLLGHWADQAMKAAFERCDSDDDELDMTYKQPNDTPSLVSREGRYALRGWQRDSLNPSLKEVFGDLSQFRALEHLLLENLLNTTEAAGHQFEYIYSSTIASALRNLPLTQDLKSLTLDLCPSLDYSEVDDAHMCEDLAMILPRIQNVRVRLKLICPSLFEPSPDLTPSEIRLQSLVIKLHQPQFPDTRHLTAKSCTAMQGSQNSTYCT